MGFIYKITNKLNNHNYIGQTTTSIENRFRQHCRSADENNHFHNALSKYGKDNFYVELIEECDDDKLNNREIYWIELYKNKGEAQYNTAGGGYNSPFKYKSEEEKKLIVEKTKLTMSLKSEDEIKLIHSKQGHPGETNPNYGGSDKHREGCRQYYANNPGAHKGTNNPFYGKTHSKEVRSKLSDSAKGNHRNPMFKNQQGENNFNYGKHGSESANHKSVRVIFKDSTYMDFGTRKELGEYFGYSCGNKPPMNKIIHSTKFPKLDGAIVVYT